MVFPLLIDDNTEKDQAYKYESDNQPIVIFVVKVKEEGNIVMLITAKVI